MPTRELLSPAQRAQMLRIPDNLSDQLIARYYTFSEDDLQGSTPVTMTRIKK